MLHSKQWYYSLHRDFQNCYSTRRILTRFFKLQFQLQCYTCTLHYNPENSQFRIQFYIQKNKELFEYYSPEMHPCVLHDIPGNSSCSRDIPDIPDIPVIHDLPAFPGNSTDSTMFQYLQGIHPIPAFSD